MESKKVFKSQAGRETDDPGKELVRLAKERQAVNATLSFSNALALTMEAEPELARGWLVNDET